MNYQWNKSGTTIAGAVSAVYTTPATVISDDGAQFTALVTNNAGSVTSKAAYLHVKRRAAPSITTQPASQTVTAGQTATFGVVAAGTAPLNYQWNRNGVAISGAVSSSYMTPATASSDNGSTFNVMVSNAAGTATSNAATLTVNPAPAAPAITTQPSNQTVTAGQTATFTVTATGTGPLGYQWQENSQTISGATAPSYTTPSTISSDSGSTFKVVVSNSAGTATSNAVTLTVNPAPAAPAITTQPSNQTATSGQAATFTATATGTAPLSYQWQKNNATISGATAATYITPPTTTSDNGSQFKVIVSNSVGSTTSNSAILTVDAPTFLLNASPTTLSFGSVNIGASRSLSVTLTNSGNSSVTVSSVSVIGADFTTSGVSAGSILNVGQSATLTVNFAPATTGSVTDNVSVASNASNSPTMISLSGSGTQQSAAYPFWVMSSLVRVGQSDAPGTTSSITLSGARGETVDSQVIVHAPAGGLTH
ncbi:MAG TPA: choice-of-anchor D domain-containing protein, partial [Candidatus Acidoferrales bacterium]|nr:choice-of-anchor D domain-containing protein [Candidatus Acidoferrales bacterium]